MTVYEIITKKITDRLEQGKIPWNIPWLAGQPQNLVTKHKYTGINVWMLSMIAEECGYTSPYWITQKEMVKRGGRVPKEIYFDREKHGLVVFSKTVEKKTSTKEDRDTYWLLRFTKVFNLDTVEGIEKPEKLEGEIIEADEMVKKSPAPIVYEGSRACYNVKEDLIKIPRKETFKDLPGFYSTVYHEMIHSTGHKSRLDRFKDNQTVNKSEEYSKEELTAELGAAFLCNQTGIDHIEQGAAYIQSWLKALKNDSRLLISAASKAQKAVEFINN